MTRSELASLLSLDLHELQAWALDLGIDENTVYGSSNVALAHLIADAAFEQGVEL